MASARKPRESDAFGLLGLAKRAGVVVTGVAASRRALEGHELGLVLFASDASETQLVKVRGLLHHRNVPVRWVSGQEVLGRTLGEGPLSVVGIKTHSFATQLLDVLASEPQGSSEG